MIKRIKTAKSIFIMIALLSILLTPAVSRSAKIVEEQINPVTASIQHKLRRPSRISGEIIGSSYYLKKYYKYRDYSPVWLSKNKPSKQAKEMLKTISESPNEGLPTTLFHYNTIQDLFEKAKKKDATTIQLANLDILLTDAFFLIASHYRYGYYNPFKDKINGFKRRRDVDFAASLDVAIDKKKVQSILENYLPKNPGYKRLKEKLKYYQKISSKGGWPTNIPYGPKIRSGSEDPRIPIIRKRIAIEDNITMYGPPNKNIYDLSLKQGIMEFQKNNGLLDDGIIGRYTVVELRKPVKSRICQIRVNLDRIRAYNFIKNDPDYIIVNIPNFQADVIEDGKVVMSMKAILGQSERTTPLLSDEIEYIVMSPDWRVPAIIAVEDKLPKILEDPDYFRKHNVTVYDGDEKDAEEIDPSTIDWTEIDPENFEEFPYRFVQAPGRYNALGTIKFMFPNEHSVYLHDTPSKRLFDATTRMFSSGCIRVEKAVELAEYLLRNRDGWTKKKIKKEMLREKPKDLYLKNHMPIHIIYLTAWVDDNKTLQFRRDIYKYDNVHRNIFCSN